MRPSTLPRRIANCLYIGMIILVLASAITHWLNQQFGGQALGMLDHLLGYDQSGLLPTLYGSLLLLACSVALGITAYVKFMRRGVFIRHWGALALVFAGLSLDKALGVHHYVIGPIRSIQYMLHLTSGKELIVAGAAALVVYAVYARFLRCLPPRYRYQLLAGGAIFLFGGIFYDKFGHVLADKFPSGALITQFIRSFEDALEIGGTIVFLHALLEYMAELQIPFAFPQRQASYGSQELAATVDLSPKPQ